MSGYVFGSARGERRRLELLDQAFRPSSEALLRRAIEHPPTLAYDLGCGIGTTTRLMARVTGAERSVGLDDSAALLNAARARAGRAVSFARHDVTESPFPQGSADMVFARFLLAHLERPATTASSWASQLREGGLLVLEEIEWIEADQRALAAHVALVGKLISSTGTTMCAGPQLWSLRGDPALELRFAEVVEVSVPTGLAARMFGLSLAGWGRHAARLGLVTESERLGLARELDDLVISRAESEIRWGLHQACFRRVCS